MSEKSAVQEFVVLYNLRMATQKYLLGDKEARFEMLKEMDNLVEFRKSNDIKCEPIVDVFDEITKEFVTECSRVSVDKLMKLDTSAEVFSEEFKETLVKLKELKESMSTGVETQQRNTRASKDSKDVQALKAEVLGWIKAKLKPEEQEKAKQQLAETESLVVKGNKNKIELKFGDYTVELMDSTKGKNDESVKVFSTRAEILDWITRNVSEKKEEKGREAQQSSLIMRRLLLLMIKKVIRLRLHLEVIR